MNLSNYSAEDAIDEVITSRANIPELLRHAAALNGIVWVREQLVSRGLSRLVAHSALRSCGLLPHPPPRTAAPLDTLLRTLRRDLPRLDANQRAVILDLVIAHERDNPIVAP